MARQPEQALVTAYVAQHNRLRLAAGTALGRLWDRVANVDDVAAERFAELAAQTALAAQIQTAANVDGYMAALLGVMLDDGSPVGIDVERVTGPAVRAGAEPLDVYTRAIVTARTALSNGQQWVDAMSAGRARAVEMVEFDVALTQRAATLEVVNRDDRVVGYRRVLTGKSCDLCQIASTQRYHREDLMPIHGHCDCGVAPIVGDRDPGRVINKELLGDLKRRGAVDKITRQQALPKAQKSLTNARGQIDKLRDEIKAETNQERETRLEKRLDRWQQEVARREKRVATLIAERKTPKVAVHEHGELGPLLTDASQDFTGPADIAA